MDVVIFDLETTGFSRTWHEIIQIAAVRMQNGRVVQDELFSTFVRPARRVPLFITEITGITHSDVCDAPCAADALSAFSRFVGRSTLIAHNGRRFDMPFIREACARHRVPTRPSLFVDSMDFSRSIWSGRGGHGLDAIMCRLGMPADANGRHTAPGDVACLGEAVSRMWRRLSNDFETCPLIPETGYLPA